MIKKKKGRKKRKGEKQIYKKEISVGEWVQLCGEGKKTFLGVFEKVKETSCF